MIPTRIDQLAHLPGQPAARSKSGVSPQRPRFTLACDDWTFHSIELFLSGRQPAELLRAIKASLLRPEVHSRWFRDPTTGRTFVRGYSVITHLLSRETTRLLSLREVAAVLDASLQEFPWLRDPRLSVSRIDLASDHLVSAPPSHLCALIAEVNLPHSQRIATYRERGDPWHTVYHVSGRRSDAPIPFEEHHRKGKQPMVIAHYPRLEALLERPGPVELPATTVEYAEHRLRQEVRFRREAVRRYIGPGSASLGAVLGSVPAFVRATRRRLRPIVEDASILSFPRLDPEGEAALMALAGGLP